MSSSASAAKQRSTAWTYLVVSSEQQAETIAYQRRWAAEVALQRSWTITETFEGVSSGKDGTRALLKKLVDRLEKTPRAERPERVLMIRLDRLGRGLGLEALAALAQITQLGVTVHTRQDGDYKIARASDSLLPLMRIVTGGIENEARRDKALDTYRRRRLNGLAVSNKRPYCIKIVEGRDVACEPEVGAVRLAFELAANGFGYSAIGSRLVAVAPPKRYASGRIHETNWTNDRVRKMLRTTAYRGVVIQERQWDRVHRLLDRAPDVRVRIHPWPLSGALHCVCGRILIGSHRGSPTKRVYRCVANKVHGRCRTFPALKLERQFSDLLESLTASPRLMREYAMQSERLVELDEESLRNRHDAASEGVDRAESERTRVWKLNANGLLPDVHLARKLTDVDKQVATYRTVMAEIEVALQRNVRSEEELEQALSLLREAVPLWNSATATDQATAARALARSLRGLCVLENGTLQIGPPTEWKRFFRADSAGRARIEP